MAKVLKLKTTGRQKVRISGVGQYDWEEEGGGGGGGGGGDLVTGTPVAKIDARTDGEVHVQATGFGQSVTIEALIGGGTVKLKSAGGDAVLESADGSCKVKGNGGDVTLTAPYGVRIQAAAGDPICEYGGPGAAQLAHINNTSGETLAQTQAKIDLLFAYLQARGTMA